MLGPICSRQRACPLIVLCSNSASDDYRSLCARLHGRTPEMIVEVLRLPDCIVTSQVDKDKQLNKIPDIHERVSEHEYLVQTTAHERRRPDACGLRRHHAPPAPDRAANVPDCPCPPVPTHTGEAGQARPRGDAARSPPPLAETAWQRAARVARVRCIPRCVACVTRVARVWSVPRGRRTKLRTLSPPRECDTVRVAAEWGACAARPI